MFGGNFPSKNVFNPASKPPNLFDSNTGNLNQQKNQSEKLDKEIQELSVSLRDLERENQWKSDEVSNLKSALTRKENELKSLHDNPVHDADSIKEDLIQIEEDVKEMKLKLKDLEKDLEVKNQLDCRHLSPFKSCKVETVRNSGSQLY